MPAVCRSNWVGRRWCVHGHYLPEVGVYERPSGLLQCRKCHAQQSRTRAAARRRFLAAVQPDRHGPLWDDLSRLTDLD